LFLQKTQWSYFILCRMRRGRYGIGGSQATAAPEEGAASRILPPSYSIGASPRVKGSEVSDLGGGNVEDDI
jgi:hypothetical protein